MKNEMQEKLNIPNDTIVFFDGFQAIMTFEKNGNIKIKDTVVANNPEVVEGIKRIMSNLQSPFVSNGSVPFIDEVEEFNEIMGKPNNYTPVIPDEKEWMFVYNFILEELEEYKHACETGNIVEVLDALCDITYVSLLS